ncbi:hypothetical protein WICANDRAFT_78921 [Wickerhamomyces anomalus NRRL Y-366-8]|uniref:Zn(2)-C6 fungal-type domain-containing protein n=1 Tax=Wickerhamomyces anomalus (strain ATCC 58044 / CBS 1984 / NCYC 433 / NRRL Y-366-8) TaxID=683960 RepID=A0A1E3P643_WICAA|nr:uncharacterized protein WICANDRAFT_78921 [Wickerhamomyces anomalus NRRL Y-366-8]ODQ60317.1 hypothetical protein WICANDRAFT_78921 [Wickerhamomyces anomalus NRRL Y-366-8]
MSKRKFEPEDNKLFNVFTFSSRRVPSGRKSCSFCREKKVKCVNSEDNDERCKQCKTRDLSCSLCPAKAASTNHSSPSTVESPAVSNPQSSPVDFNINNGAQFLDLIGDMDWINVLDEELLQSDFPLAEAISINQNPGSTTRISGYNADTNGDGIPIDKRHGDTSFMYYGFSGEYDPFLRFNYYSYDDNDECFFKQKFFRKLGDSEMPAVFSFKTKKLLREQTKEYSTPGFDKKMIKKLYKCAPNLAVLYMKFIFPFLPILDGDFLGKIFSNETVEFNDISGGSPLFTLLLAKIGKGWERHDTSMSIFFDDQELPILKNRNELFTVAWNLLQDELHTPDLTTVKSLILFFQIISFKKYSQSNSFERTVLSNLVSVCFTLGLHVDCSDWKIPDDEKALRKRLWWTVFIMEKWNNFVVGTPSLINEKSYNVEIPSDINELFEDVSQYFSDINSKKFFLKLIELTFILNDTDEKLFSFQSVPKEEKPDAIRGFEEKLSIWYDGFKEIESASSVPFHSITLSYFVLKLILFRSRFQIYGVNKFKDICFDDAKVLLRDIVKFLRNLPSLVIHGFWYNWSRSLFMYIKDFSLLLVVISSTKEQSLEVLNIIKDFREWLEMNSKTLCLLWTTLLRINTATSSIGTQFKNSLKRR